MLIAAQGTRGWVKFVVGVLAGLALPLALAEVFLRANPPADIQLYLGNRSSLSGPYRPDPVIGVAYQSFDAFQSVFARRLGELGPLVSAQPTWLFLGNSFVHARGMLGETMRGLRPRERIFYLRRNEPSHVRAAQLRALLEQGLRPRRVFFVLIPLDVSVYGSTPLASIAVNDKGAPTLRVRTPPSPFDHVVNASRLALTAWVRSGRHRANPRFRPAHLTAGLSAQLKSDWGRILGEISRLSRRFDVPVTVLLLPDRKQVLAGRADEPQRSIAALARAAGLDVLDVEQRFMYADGDRRRLFLPDGHYSAAGNAILAEAVIGHMEKPELAATVAEPRP